MDDPDEVLDLVDDDDKVIGTIVREDVPKLVAGEITGIYRAVDGFIANSKGQLWIPRRSMLRKIAPGGLDVGVGEHVQSGETYLDAVLRGFREEAGLHVTAKELQYIGKIDLRSVPLPVFEAVYLFRHDEIPHFNPEDFTGYEWLTPKEILDRIAVGEVVKLNLKMAVELLQASGKL